MAKKLLADSLGYFQIDNLDVDNWTFKLFSKFSVGLFMVASAVSVATSYFGDPIKCLGISNKGYRDTYCWLHGSYHIPNRMLGEQVNKGDDCFRPPYSTKTDPHDQADTDYYLWVPVMFILHSFIFMVPDRIWKHYEGGVMAEFISEKEKSTDDAEKHARFFKTLTKNHNNRYFLTFVFCELLNLISAVINFFIIDRFFSGNFVAYGKKVLQYYFYRETLEAVRVTYTGTNNDQTYMDVRINPMCSAFPTLVSCNVETIGSAGGKVIENHICILAQNLIYEKIYLLFWFWFIILFVASVFNLMYRLLATILPVFRKRRLQSVLRSRNFKKLEDLRIIDENIYGIGGWFILCQIGRNSSPYYFRRLLNEVAKTHYKGKYSNLNDMERGDFDTLDMKQKMRG